MSNKIAAIKASFSYGDKPVWNDLDFEVAQGESICLLGPNGCGKTTLLNCLHGDLRLKTGRIELEGNDIGNLDVIDIARKVGYVFQEHAAPFPYNSIDVVTMGRAPHLGLFQSPSPDDVALADEIMAEMGISHLRDQRYTKISGGERQLVLIARTLCQEPEIILFDEPTSHLDFKNQALVLNTINRLSEKGMTIIMTSHFPNHAWLLNSRVAMMSDRGFTAVGTVAEVMNEANLSETYGLRVKVYQAQNDGRTVSFCVPELCGNNACTCDY